MANKTVDLVPEVKGFSLSWQTTNKKNRKHKMRHFLEISSASEIKDIAEACGWEFNVSYTRTKKEERDQAFEFLMTMIETSQTQDCDCEIPVADLPYKYVQLIHSTQRCTDPFFARR